MKIYLSCLLFTLTSLTEVANVPLSSEPTPSVPVNGANVNSTEPNVSNATITPSSVPLANTTTSAEPAPSAPAAISQLENSFSDSLSGLGNLSNVLAGLPELNSTISAVPGLGDLLNFILSILNSVLTAMPGSPLVNAISSIPSSILLLRSLLANVLGFPGLSVETSGGSTDIAPDSQSLPTGNNGLTTLLNTVLTLDYYISTYIIRMKERSELLINFITLGNILSGLQT